MKFTVVFSSHESYDCSYGLVFTPCPSWVKGNEELLNLNPHNPSYQLGSIKKLLDVDNAREHLIGNECALVIHNQGYGTENDLANLIKDLETEGFSIKIVEIDNNKI